MCLTKFSHTPETWARLLAKPEDRRAVLGPVFEAAGGKLHGYWYASGDADGFVLFEAPDDVITAGPLVKVAPTAQETAACKLAYGTRPSDSDPALSCRSAARRLQPEDATESPVDLAHEGWRKKARLGVQVSLVQGDQGRYVDHRVFGQA
jgi:uncharacterized protein with GYD domain